MYKKLTAIAAAMFILTACGAKNTADTENTPSESPTESVSDTVSEAASETESETASEAETEAASESEVSTSSDVYDGEYYTITVDPAKWTNANDMRQAAGEVAESLDNGLDLSADQYVEMCDAIFSYNDTPEGAFAANFNIVTQDIGVEMDMDAETFGPVMEEGFSGVEGYDFIGWEGAEVNGYNCLITKLNVEQMGIKMKMQQYIFLKGGKQTVVTLTAAEENYDEVFPDFEKAVSTVTLK